MEKPTLEEIKERYKYAKSVRCLNDNHVYNIKNIEIYRTLTGRGNDFYCYGYYNNERNTVLLFNSLNNNYAEIVEYKTEEIPIKHEEVINTPEYYDNTNGSLYLIAKQRGWNAYQFDLIKRIDRATKKGEFEKDLNKSKNLIDLWLKENNNKLNSK